MIAISDPFMAGQRPSGLQKGRGGFLRSADDAPYVSDPSGDVVKSGERKGEVKRVKYGSPSGVGRLIENDVGLTKYKQRLTLLGIGMDEALVAACEALVDMDQTTDEFRRAADTIVVEADKLTRSWLAADRGSHGHAICEHNDAGTNWEHLIADGEALGIDKATQIAVANAWDEMLYDNGLEILAIEAACVDDLWRLAGTLDRIVRCTRELRFVKPDGELVVIPAGTVLILDIKFGQLRRAHLIQCASYSQSVPYDTDLELRGVWPWPIDQDHALIAHGDFGGDGRPVTIELVWVDLRAGREHGGATVAAAKAWSGRDDLWSVAQIVEGASSYRDVDGVNTLAPSTPSTGEGERRAAHGDALPGDAWTVVDECTGGEDCKTTTHIHGCYRDRPCPHEPDLRLAPDPARLAIVNARATLTVEPDQGRDLADPDFDPLWAELKALFDGLPDTARAWRSQLVTQAQRRNVPFHAQAVKTERTYWINKAVISLALSTPDDGVLRELMAHVIGDVALFPSVEAGHVLGSLGHLEAKQLANRVDRYNLPPSAA